MEQKCSAHSVPIPATFPLYQKEGEAAAHGINPLQVLYLSGF